MRARATGLYRIYRGSSTNASGDEVAADYLVASDVPMALHNNTSNEDNPNTANPRVLTVIRGRANPDVDLQAEDRIEDQDSGRRYVVDTVIPPLSSTGNSDLGFSVHRVN